MGVGVQFESLIMFSLWIIEWGVPVHTHEHSDLQIMMGRAGQYECQTLGLGGTLQLVK